jgi:tetratricopeptide (TPR) repeat protein
LNTVASLLRDIDEHERAADLSAAAVQTARDAKLTRTDAYIEALGGQTTAARLLGRGAEAIAARDEALQLLDARNDRTSLLRARVNTNTVAQFSADPRREIALVEQAVALFEERYPAEPEYFTALYYLANLHRTQQRPIDAERYFRRAIGVFERVGSRDFTNLGASYAFAGASAQSLGDTQAALADYERGLEILDRHAGPDSLVTRFQRTHYAESLYHAGRIGDALAIFENLWRAAETRGRTIAEFDASVYQAFALLDAGRPAAAQRVLERFEQDWADFGKRFAPNGRRWVAQLAFAHAMQGRRAQAREALALIGRLPPTFYQSDITVSAEYLAELLWIELAIGDEAATREVLKKAADALASDPQSFDWSYARLNAHAALSLRTSAPSQALQHAQRAVAHLRTHAKHGAFPFLEARTLVARGEAQLELGNVDAAIADLEAGRSIMERLHALESPWLMDVHGALAQARHHEGDLSAAREHIAQARAIASRHRSLAPWFEMNVERAEALLRAPNHASASLASGAVRR